VLFLSSYTPLFVIFAIRYWEDERTIAVVAIAVGVLGVAGLLTYERQARRLAGQFERIDNVESRTGDAMAYIVTYIIPFLDVDTGSRADLIALVVLFIVLGVLYVNSNLIYFNPLLNFMGYHIFEVSGADKLPRMMLTKRHYVRPGENIEVATLGDYLWLEKGS